MNNLSLSQQAFQNRKLPIIPLVIAQQCTMFPLYFFIPVWISLVNIIIAFAVIWSAKNHYFKINRWLKIMITLTLIAGVFFSFNKITGRDAGVALISIMYGLKLLETSKIRDANLLLSLSFFILLAGFLFTQKPWIAFYQIIPIIAILNAFVAINSINLKQQRSFSINKVFKDFSKYLLLALPIMVILFVFFPRLSGPIWRMPNSSTGISGVSDSMTPGDISDLHMSDEIAFRVQFNNATPDESQMYWRALTLNQFDGLAWTYKPSKVISDPQNIDPSLNQFSYKITMEATKQKFLVMLDRPIISPKRALLRKDFSTLMPYKVLDRIRYSGVSSPDYLLTENLTPEVKSFYTQLPRSSNPKSLKWAKTYRQLFNNDEEFINYILQQINQKEYFYTLTPPIMDEDIVDSFWFKHKRGFCEHYSGALVFLARAANIPARVVLGYQGAEKNPLSDYWIVRSARAHAWTEIWLDKKGWVRFDPTSAIAPHRIEKELLSHYRQRQSLFDNFDFIDLDDHGLYQQFNYWMDEVNSHWNEWILDYSSKTQSKIFQHWGLSKLNSQQILLLMIFLVAIFVLLPSIKWFHHKKTNDPIEKSFLRLQKILAKKQLVKFDASLGAHDLKKLLLKKKAFFYRKTNPQNFNHLITMLDTYIQIRYQFEQPNKTQIDSFLKQSSKAVASLKKIRITQPLL